MLPTLKSVCAHVRREVLEPPQDRFQVLNRMRGISAYLVIRFHVAMFSGSFPIANPKADLNWFHLSINGFWAFFMRRSMRIFPAFYLVLTAAVFWYLRYEVGEYEFFLMGGGWEKLHQNSWQNYTYTMNYLFKAGDPNPMSWGWSLCVEEHFYLLLPLLLALTFRTRRRGMRPAWLWVGMLVPFALRAVQYARNPDIALLDGFYYRSHNRFDEVWYGVLVAYCYVYHYDTFARLVRRAGNWTWAIGFALFIAVMAATTLLTGVMFVCFESPLIELGRRWSHRFRKPRLSRATGRDSIPAGA